MSLLKSITRLTENVTEIVTAPVKIAVDTATIATKPIKDAAKVVTEGFEELAKDEDEE